MGFLWNVKVCIFNLYLAKIRRFIKMNLSVNAEGSVELNDCMLCVHGLLKGSISGMAEYINLEYSGNNKGDDHLTEKIIFARYYYNNYCCFYFYPILLLLQLLSLQPPLL